MPTQNIEIGGQTPIAAASALKKAGYSVTSGGKPINVSETDDKEKELTDGKGSIHTKKWDRCVKKVKASGKSETSAYRICSSSIEDAGVKSGHQRKSGKQYMANRNESEVNEGDNMFDVFPELNQCVPQEGGEIKDVKIKDHKKPAEKPKDVKYKKVKRERIPQMENVIVSKKELLEAIMGAAQPAPSKPAPQSPTTAPTKPGQKPQRQNPFKPKPGPNPNPKGEMSEVVAAEPAPSKPAPQTPTIAPTKPGQKPQRQNPFRPKPGPNPNPKGSLPSWLSSDQLGIGKQSSLNESEIKKIIKNLI